MFIGNIQLYQIRKFVHVLPIETIGVAAVVVVAEAIAPSHQALIALIISNG